MSSTAKVFNNQLYNLLECLHNRFPESKELKLALTGIDTVRNYNPKRSLDIFVMYGYRYREFIINTDRRGLKALDLEQEISQIKDSIKSNKDLVKTYDHIKSQIDVNDYEGIDIMSYILRYWDSLDRDEKDNIWKYLTVLVKLADKYIADSLNNSK
jgi:hypothetical protein